MLLCCALVQLKTALATEPVDSAWTSRAAVGALTLVTQAKASALRVPTEDPFRPRSQLPPPCLVFLLVLSLLLTPACVPAKPSTIGPLFTAQVMLH